MFFPSTSFEFYTYLPETSVSAHNEGGHKAPSWLRQAQYSQPVKIALWIHKIWCWNSNNDLQAPKESAFNTGPLRCTMAPFREMEMRDGLRASQMATLCSPEAQTNGDLLVPSLETGWTEHVMTEAIPSQRRRKDHLSSRVGDGVRSTSLAGWDSSNGIVRKTWQASETKLDSEDQAQRNCH